MEIYWKCKNCNGTNCDDYVLTCFPICGDCGKQRDWEDILSPEELQRGNDILKTMETE